jgi:SPP1 family predicted phage head-tail adaptor
VALADVRVINSGELSERLTLQNPPSIDDGSGGQTGDWATVTTISAKVEPVRGGEAAQAAVATMTVQYRVTIRRRPVSSGQRLLWTAAAQVMDIRAVLPSIDRAWTVLLCEARAA